MHQVLFRIPIPIQGWLSDGIPIYGFGFMLFLAFLVCTWVANRRAEEEGIKKEQIQDLSLWLFIGGIVGARMASVLLEGMPLSEFFRIWDGGLVFYGSIFGGLAGYGLAYLFILRKHAISSAPLLDVYAPCIAVGLCLGRLGCLLNGCCFGEVACPECYSVHFPLSSPARFQLVQGGYQTAAGFAMDERALEEAVVGAVDPASSAARVGGLRKGDTLVSVNKRIMENGLDFARAVREKLKDKGKADLDLVVLRGGKEVELPRFEIDNNVGITMADCTVAQVTPESAAVRQGLRQGDVITALNGHPVISYRSDLVKYLGEQPSWPRGKDDLDLTIVHPDSQEPVVLPPFKPRTLGLYPTQVYESISMALAFLLMLAYLPFRRRRGELMALLMFCYGLHRFWNEKLRDDPRPVGFEKYISVLLIVTGVVFWLWLRRPVKHPMPALATAAS